MFIILQKDFCIWQTCLPVGWEKEINAAADKLTKTTNESFFGRLFPSKTHKLTYQAPEHFLNVPNTEIFCMKHSKPATPRAIFTQCGTVWKM
jgi:hypothetical protein